MLDLNLAICWGLAFGCGWFMRAIHDDSPMRKGGYQPIGDVDPARPPQGGSGVPPKLTPPTGGSNVMPPPPPPPIAWYEYPG